MTTVSFNSRVKPDQADKVFSYFHNATSWLLLAGYLPTEGDNKVFINIYTNEIATIEVAR